jgi:hypothetical protein
LLNNFSGIFFELISLGEKREVEAYSKEAGVSSSLTIFLKLLTLFVEVTPLLL